MIADRTTRDSPNLSDLLSSQSPEVAQLHQLRRRRIDLAELVQRSVEGEEIIGPALDGEIGRIQVHPPAIAAARLDPIVALREE